MITCSERQSQELIAVHNEIVRKKVPDSSPLLIKKNIDENENRSSLKKLTEPRLTQ